MDNDEPMEYQWIVAIANKLGASRQHCFSERLGHTENKVVVGGGVALEIGSKTCWAAGKFIKIKTYQNSFLQGCSTKNWTLLNLDSCLPAYLLWDIVGPNV